MWQGFGAFLPWNGRGKYNIKVKFQFPPKMPLHTGKSTLFWVGGKRELSGYERRGEVVRFTSCVGGFMRREGMLYWLSDMAGLGDHG